MGFYVRDKERREKADNKVIGEATGFIEEDFEYAEIAAKEAKISAEQQLNKQNRERRERPRMSDIERSVDKVQPLKMEEEDNIPCCDGNVASLLPPYFVCDPPDIEGHEGYDENTGSSLQEMRWEIYSTIDKYIGNIPNKHIPLLMKQEVERLFKKYTNS